MKLRWKIVLALIIALPLLASLWTASLHIGATKEVDAYKKSLRAQGEELEITNLLPPSIPPDQNGLTAFNEATSLITPDGVDWTNLVSGMHMIAPGKAMPCFAQPFIYDSTFTNSWSNVLAVAEENRPAVELFEQAATFPRMDFHIDYTQGPETLLRYLPDLKRAAQMLSTAAICHLHQGDAASATTNICAALGIINADRDDRFLISQLVRFAMASIVANATWELLQTTNVDDGELARLQKNWEQLDYLQPFENSILMERASDEMTIHKMRTSREYFNHLMHAYAPTISGSSSEGWDPKDLWAGAKFGYAQYMWCASWTYSDELRLLQVEQILLETIRTIDTNGCFNPAYDGMDTRLNSLGVTNSPDNIGFNPEFDLRWMFSGDAQGLTTSLRRCMTAEVTQNIVITAIALKRYQLNHGRYPDTLSQLVPQFLAAVPKDPVDGQPLRYHPNPDATYLLYSIGLNGKDDGGNPSLDVSSSSTYYNNWLNLHAFDWVWPQPATPAKIQAFYDHPPK